MDDKREHTLVRDGLVTVSQGSIGSVGQPLQVQQTLTGQAGTFSTNTACVNVRTFERRFYVRFVVKHCNHVSKDFVVVR